MKTFIVLAVLIAVALAAPLDDSRNAQILRYENDNIGVDGYKFAYETSDGVAREETAELRNIGTEQAIVVRGTVSWVGPDGVTYKLDYIADENGFQPQGSHLPVA
ncbi:flexible cuticle protein 12-like [Phlebotomus papatasi]|uniref:Uncharacterized protein n=1 Tax=Phlebotomus papatasi TaxID=29031 RepID=A0A1B0EWW3_PHLPP|nr:flexible cuticle protein 12-like [Phlebotomus papatasi]